MQALIKWKDRDSIRKLFVETRDSWTEEELDSVVQYESNYEPYRVCRRSTFLRECSDEKIKLYP